ncbi:HD domain-containing protein [Shimia sp. R9_1]|uniref:HD domain-containing protein n=1 Tax=unclassified Shimia TaxID=2630038 RepID=UPI001AD9A9E7|nr:MULTISPECIES: HD domain-containing protein [unclassified Shimia]MBO9395455.1 HD domain-containing protein [Shimia sp. R9_2]MBO9407459.1 HD domain-containing protein [Shimia sp. R9_1]
MLDGTELQELRTALRDVAAERMAQDSGHDLAHLDRVWSNAQRLARSEGEVDLKILLGAAYLHDLVNLPKNAPNRSKASTLAAAAAAPVLRELGFDNHQVAATQHAIAAHSFSAGLAPKSKEARILRDADRLDALGMIGIARTFAVSGALGTPLYDPQDPFATSRDLDDGAFALDHWPVKLFRLPEDMLTQAGKAIAKERVANMRRYAAVLASELGIVLPDSWS